MIFSDMQDTSIDEQRANSDLLVLSLYALGIGLSLHRCHKSRLYYYENLTIQSKRQFQIYVMMSAVFFVRICGFGFEQMSRF